MRRALLLSLLGLALGSAPSAAGVWSAGTIRVRVGGSVIDHTVGSLVSEFSNGPDGVSIDHPWSDVPLFETLIASDGGGMASAYGFAGMASAPGGVQVTVNGSDSASPSSNFIAAASTYSVATATIYDSFTINVPSLPPESPLTLTAHIFVNGTLLAQAFGTDSAYADWGSFVAPAGLASSNVRWDVTLRTQTALPSSSTAYAWCLQDRDEDICSAPVLGLDHEFYAGNGATVTYELEVTAQAGVGARAHGVDPSLGSAVANADGVSDVGGLAPSGGGSAAGAAAGWGGLTVTSQGNPVAFNAISTTSGFDHHDTFVPAPEIGGGLAQAIALVALAPAAWRRARRS